MGRRQKSFLNDESDTHQGDKEEEYSGKDNRNRRKGVEKMCSVF